MLPKSIAKVIGAGTGIAGTLMMNYPEVLSLSDRGETISGLQMFYEQVAPTAAEIKGVVNTLSQRIELVNSVITENSGKSVEPETVNEILQNVQQIFLKPENNSTENLKIKSINFPSNLKLFTQQIIIKEKFDENDKPVRWEDLSDKYPCPICADVLAAPVLLNCSHSYCWSCVSELLEASSKHNSRISPSCPTCKESIESYIYERTFDENISAQINNMPDSDYKRDWIARKEAFSNRPKSCSSPIGRKTTEDDSEVWREVCDHAIPVVIFLVLVLVLAARPV